MTFSLSEETQAKFDTIENAALRDLAEAALRQAAVRMERADCDNECIDAIYEETFMNLRILCAYGDTQADQATREYNWSVTLSAAEETRDAYKKPQEHVTE